MNKMKRVRCDLMYGTTTDYGSPTVEKAPTLMEALRDAQERMAILEEQLEDHKDRITTMERMVQ